MVSAAANNVIGALGGAVLAACLVPQVVKLLRSKRANDLSYGYLTLYATGLTLTFVYLFFEGATVAWICMLVEVVFCCLTTALKCYYDFRGPYSARAKAAAEQRSLQDLDDPGSTELRSVTVEEALVPEQQQGAGRVLLDCVLTPGAAATPSAALLARLAAMLQAALGGGRQVDLPSLPSALVFECAAGVVSASWCAASTTLRVDFLPSCKGQAATLRRAAEALRQELQGEGAAAMVASC